MVVRIIIIIIMSVGRVGDCRAGPSPPSGLSPPPLWLAPLSAYLSSWPHALGNRGACAARSPDLKAVFWFYFGPLFPSFLFECFLFLFFQFFLVPVFGSWFFVPSLCFFWFPGSLSLVPRFPHFGSQVPRFPQFGSPGVSSAIRGHVKG